MIRKTFSQEMHGIRDEVLLLGSMVANAVMASVQALKDNDLQHSQQILDDDRHINTRRYQIEASIMVLIAAQQPIARDLRILAASLDICTELERIGDYAKGIAVINLRSKGLSMPVLLYEVSCMAEQAVGMLRGAMTAYANEDVEFAGLVIAGDDVVDTCYNTIYTKAVQSVISDPRNIDRANYFIWIAHNLERLGDRATNICERVMFIVTGERHPEAIALA